MMTTTAAGKRQDKKMKPKRVVQARAPGIISQSRIIIMKLELVKQKAEEIVQSVLPAAQDN